MVHSARTQREAQQRVGRMLPLVVEESRERPVVGIRVDGFEDQALQFVGVQGLSVDRGVR
ncbi:hypothetical protein C3486_32260 [Streptomyces sp. Ru73]|nr:hypothetical protein C3486_32260 [Streptomyces sp. Ru73]